MQTVEQLSLVLVDPLHLYVKDGVRVHLHLAVLLQEGGKLEFVLLKEARVDTCQNVWRRRARRRVRVYLFDCGHLSEEGAIVHKLQDLLQLVKIGEEVVSDSLTGKTRIG